MLHELFRSAASPRIQAEVRRDGMEPLISGQFELGQAYSGPPPCLCVWAGGRTTNLDQKTDMAFQGVCPTDKAVCYLLCCT